MLDLINRSRTISSHYTDTGVFPRWVLLERYPHAGPFSIHAWSGEAGFQWLFFGIAFGLAALMLVGYRTRWVTVGSWAMLISLHNRNPLLLHGGDSLLNAMMLWAMFLPWGARWSLDSRSNPPPSQLPVMAYSMGTAGLLLQTAVLYWFTAWLKSGLEWQNGTAVAYALYGEYGSEQGLWLAQFPALCRFLAHAVIGLEWAGPVLLFMPVRTALFRMVALGLFGLMHLGFYVFLTIALFPWISLASLLPFLPAEFWNGILRRRDGTSTSPIHFLTARPWINALAGCLLIFIIFTNAENSLSRHDIPAFEKVTKRLRLHQRWQMFAPYPLRDFRWHVIRAELTNGSEVDLLQNGQILRWEKPLVSEQWLPDYLWRRYLAAAMNFNSAGVKPALLDHFYRRWNFRLASPIRAIEWYGLSQRNYGPDRSTQPKKILLLRQSY